MEPTSLKLVHAPYYDAYLSLLKSGHLFSELDRSANEMNELVSELNESLLSFRYADDKWTISEVILHVIETEMLFNARAIRIAREQKTQIIAGFDENHYVAQTRSTDYSAVDLIKFFSSVRTSTKYLIRSMTEDQRKKVGEASGHKVSVDALFFITAGHTLHHVNVIRNKYLSKI
ncbi:MAG: DinB family protein [Salibacteraceae bacterium]